MAEDRARNLLLFIRHEDPYPIDLLEAHVDVLAGAEDVVVAAHKPLVAVEAAHKLQGPLVDAHVPKEVDVVLRLHHFVMSRDHLPMHLLKGFEVTQRRAIPTLEVENVGMAEMVVGTNKNAGQKMFLKFCRRRL